MKKIISIISLIGLFTFAAHADSPITSTDFHKAYKSEKIITTTLQSKGSLTLSLIDYLMNPKNPIGTKLALVNALSWNINGKSNAAYLWDEYLVRIYKQPSQFLQKGSAGELIVYAYLKAMDDYNHVEDALQYANAALKKDNNSYAIALIQSLIEAQSLFNSDWCKVYYVTHKVEMNKNLKMDLKPAASDIIFEYMNLYKSSCE